MRKLWKWFCEPRLPRPLYFLIGIGCVLMYAETEYRKVTLGGRMDFQFFFAYAVSWVIAFWCFYWIWYPIMEKKLKGTPKEKELKNQTFGNAGLTLAAVNFTVMGIINFIY